MRRAPRVIAGICMAASAWLTSGCQREYVRWDQPPPGTTVLQIDSATAARNAMRSVAQGKTPAELVVQALEKNTLDRIYLVIFVSV